MAIAGYRQWMGPRKDALCLFCDVLLHALETPHPRAARVHASPALEALPATIPTIAIPARHIGLRAPLALERERSSLPDNR